MNKEQETKLLNVAASAFLSNVGEEDFPENFMDILHTDKFEEGNKEVTPWEPLDYFSPKDLYDIICDHYDVIKKVVEEISTEPQNPKNNTNSQLMQGYIVLDFCNDGKHDPYAFATKEEATEQFTECVIFYDNEITNKALQKAIDTGYFSDDNGNRVLMEKLNKTHKTLF